MASLDIKKPANPLQQCFDFMFLCFVDKTTNSNIKMYKCCAQDKWQVSKRVSAIKHGKRRGKVRRET